MSIPVSRALEMLGVLQNGMLTKLTQYFSYSMVFTSVASGANATAQLQIDASSDFLIVSTSFAAIDDVTTLDVSTDPLLQLSDNASGSNLYNTPTAINNIFGTAQLPMLLPMPYLFAANATITGTLNAKTTTNATTYFLTFNGMKIWKGK